MTVAFLRKMDDTGMLAPDDAHSETVLDKWKVGDVLRCDLRRPRNVRQHRLLFAILRYLVDCGKFANEENALFWLKIATGHCDEIRVMSGTAMAVYHVPRSIAFENMGQDKFESWFLDAVNAITELVDGDADDVRNGLEEFLA